MPAAAVALVLQHVALVGLALVVRVLAGVRALEVGLEAELLRLAVPQHMRLLQLA